MRLASGSRTPSPLSTFRPKLQSIDTDRIKGVAAAVEAEAFASNWPIEISAIELAIEVVRGTQR